MEEQKETYRLFIAAFAQIGNYISIKQKLGQSFHGRWVKPKNLHMTYKFLGDVETQNIEAIVQKLKKVKYDKKQVVKFQKLKVFNKRILSLRSSNKTLYKIHEQIEELLGEEFESEQNFKPHITIMRIKKIKNKEYKELFKTLEPKGTLELRMALVKSVLTPEGVKYKVLREF